MPATWEDLVTVALLGTDRRPLPDGPPPSWAGSMADPFRDDPTHVVLGWAARHRAAVRAGSGLPVGPATPAAPPDDRERGPGEGQPELRDALARGAGPVNDAMAVLDDEGLGASPEHWPALAALAAGNPRVNRTLLASVLGARGVWFVGQNPQWARLASVLRSRLDGVTA